MTTGRVVLVGIGLGLLCVSSGLGQTGALSSVTGGPGLSGGSYTAHYSVGGALPYRIPVVRGAPYSGQRTTESARTLLDGTSITRKGPQERLFRDSAGRTRNERVMPMGGPQPKPEITIVEINDPVA